MGMWNVYLIQLRDNSYYCGASTDWQNRIALHASGKGSKYVRSRLPIKKVVAISPDFESKGSALGFEKRVKSLAKAEKPAAVRRGHV